jgi:hypothetical protein
MINWRERLVAFAIHFLVTLALAAAAGALIFLVWFPDPFQTMIGGAELFLLVVGCDLALGPLISLVIYNSRKSRRTLVIDYSIVGVVQIAALAYGIFTVVGARPVYVAFSLDRFEIVTARDIADSDLAEARIPLYRTLPWAGPRFVNVVVRPEDHNDALEQALAGLEEHQRPKFYMPFDTALEQIRKRARPVSAITGKFPDTAPGFALAMRGLQIPPERLATLPVRHSKGFWTALIDTDTGKPLRYVPVDPYGD